VSDRAAPRPSTKLRALLARDDRVLAVLGAPNAFHATIMEAAGCEAAFVGTGITGGNYTALPDTGLLSATECLQFAGYIARAVSFPVILDGDTGHGGPPAVRRLVHESIRAGLAGIRIDDQPIEGKRGTQSAGIEVVSREAAVERYQAAVRARDELDPDFVIMAQCYARDAVNGGMSELLERLNVYLSRGRVDWAQFESPHSVDEIKEARAAVAGTLSVMQGKLPRPLSLSEHLALGLRVAWYTFLPDQALKATSWAFMRDFMQRGIDAWIDFQAHHAGNPHIRTRQSNP
jgi:2-methylisocitrate lyase-like PEP mutase family enzyme